MKFFTAELSYFVRNNTGRRNIRLLSRFLVLLVALVAVYSIIFHVLMAWEGQEHSWITGVYWALTVMSTLGFGDITFQSDIGRIFSVVVLLSGMIFLLVLLPFTFIEFFYAPWMKAQSEARAPRELPKETSGHVILTHDDPVSRALIQRLKQYGYTYVLLADNIDTALKLHDEGLKVVWGDIDDPSTYEKLRVSQAAMVVATGSDTLNTNVAFTVRDQSKEVVIVTTANTPASVDILHLAGSNSVIQLGELMGKALARRSIATDARAHIIGNFYDVCIAEATAAGTPLVGKKLLDIDLRAMAGVTVAGLWKRGSFEVPGPETFIEESSVLLLSGTREQIERYNELFCIYHNSTAPVLIIGGGRVGRAAGRYLAEAQLDFRIVEEKTERIRDPRYYTVGSAAELEVLEKAGIRDTPTVIITPHADDTNIYLTLYCRKLRPDVQIIARASLEKNVTTLHRAGADFVMSYASMGASKIFNALRRTDVTIVAEGLSVFPATVSEALDGQTLLDAQIRARTECSVLAIRRANGLEVTPQAASVLRTGDELILVGSDKGRDLFFKIFHGRVA